MFGNSIALILLLNCFVSELFAQRWKPGYIVPSQGDTVFGYIRKKWPIAGPGRTAILFKKTPDGTPDVYPPLSILAFGINDGAIYRSVCAIVRPGVIKVPDSVVDVHGDNYYTFWNQYSTNDFDNKPYAIIHRPDTTFHLRYEFGHVLLLTSSFGIFEVGDIEDAFFLGFPDSTFVFDLRPIDEEARSKGTWVEDIYKEHFLNLLYRINGIDPKDRQVYEARIKDMHYDLDELVEMTVELTRLSGGYTESIYYMPRLGQHHFLF